tara:strand:+ start:351 stop:533 length:183 start_codon:yes stop_codon:yes gene_type:complete
VAVVVELEVVVVLVMGDQVVAELEEHLIQVVQLEQLIQVQVVVELVEEVVILLDQQVDQV